MTTNSSLGLFRWFVIAVAVGTLAMGLIARTSAVHDWQDNKAGQFGRSYQQLCVDLADTGSSCQKP